MATLDIPKIPLTQLEDLEATALDLTAQRMVTSPPLFSELIEPKIDPLAAVVMWSITMAIVVVWNPDRGRL